MVTNGNFVIILDAVGGCPEWVDKRVDFWGQSQLFWAKKRVCEHFSHKCVFRVFFQKSPAL
ncbi:hypothetical protein EBV26_18640 [bacterium]|jgi:hypothetical protein|nr:hypothetical protein [bacterium]